MTLRLATSADAAAIAAVYNHYIEHTVVTFEEEAVSPEEMNRRLAAVQAASLPWLVSEQAGDVVGYAYAGTWNARSAYRFSAEVTVYLGPEHARKGIGTDLYGRLLAILHAQGMHIAIGGIALPNEGSVALHEKFGFEKVAHYKEVGFKFNRWIDVGYWQRTL